MGIGYDEATDRFTKNGITWNKDAATNPIADSKDSVTAFVNNQIAKGPLKGGFTKLAGNFVEIDLVNDVINSDGVSVSINEKTLTTDGTGGYTLSMDGMLPTTQQDNWTYLDTYPKFKNLLTQAGYVTLFDEYTVFMLPDAEITYAAAPFTMLTSSGAFVSGVTDAQKEALLDIVNDHIVTQPLFTGDAAIYGVVKTKSGKNITFNGGTITDGTGTVTIDATVRNKTKASGVVLHLVDRRIQP
jgi:hypothetical protein